MAMLLMQTPQYAMSVRRERVWDRYKFVLIGIMALGAVAVFVAVALLADYQSLSTRWRAFNDPDHFVPAQTVPRIWLQRYGIAPDTSLQTDADGDGLTLYQEYVYLTDPRRADTDGDGVSDGAEVRAGTNPRGVGVLDTDRDGLPDAWEKKYGTAVTRNDRDADPDGDGLTNWQEFLYKINPTNADTDGDGYADGDEVTKGYDPSAPSSARLTVHIIIKKIGVTVPVVWSESMREEDLQRYLTLGAIHYPDTAAPGQRGNMFIAAHSSNFAWVKGNFNYIFSKLNKVHPGDTIIATVALHNGAVVEYTYKARQQRIVQPDDPWIFLPENTPVATLSTCWPLGTRQKRLVVKADLIGVRAK